MGNAEMGGRQYEPKKRDGKGWFLCGKTRTFCTLGISAKQNDGELAPVV